MKAGAGTDHPGTGGCHYHQPQKYGMVTIKHGRYANVSKRKQAALYREYVNDPDMLDLVPELALLRSFLADAMQDYHPADQQHVKHLTDMIMKVSQLVERIENIQSQQVLTLSVARLVMLKAIEVAKRYIPEEDHHRFVLEWKRDVLPDTELKPIPQQNVK